MRIGELARRSGLAPSAIRYYEREDMFSSGQIDRGSNGYRDYSISAAPPRVDPSGPGGRLLTDADAHTNERLGASGRRGAHRDP